MRWDLATIAYSVEGGYTPIQWKYVGDELAARLRQSGPAALDADQPRIHARLARLYARTGDVPRAIVSYRIALAGGYTRASVRFALAVLLARKGGWR